MSKLSVALCTYNGARYLQAQLESIASQTRPPDELVITDDCSTDSTAAIVRAFASRAAFPVRFQVNDHNVGSTRNFERTIFRCAGDVIALSDQDDVWLPAKLAKLEAALERSPDIGLVFSDAELVDETLHPLGRRLWEFSFSRANRNKFLEGRWLDVLTAYNVVTGATMAFRTRFRELAFPVPKLGDTIHDGWIALVVGLFARLVFLDEPLVLYRQHNTQQLGVDLNPPPEEVDSFYRRFEYPRVARFYAHEIARLTDVSACLNEVKGRTGNGAGGLASGQAAELENHIAKLHDRIIHYRVRGELSPRRIRRLGPVVRELLAHRYHLFSSGVLSALRDLIRDVRSKERSGREL